MSYARKGTGRARFGALRDDDGTVDVEPRMSSELEPDFLDEEPALEQTEPEATPEPTDPAQTAEITHEATAAPETREERHVPYAAMKAEREKRQRLEHELAQVQQHLQNVQQPEVDFYQQPDVYVQQHLQSVEHRTTQRFFAALEEQARESYPDFDEVFSEVYEQAQGNPLIAQQIINAANPAVAAYKLGKQAREMRQMQDPATYRQKIEAEVRAKVEAEFRDREATRARTAAAVPPDLTDNRNARGQFAPAGGDVFKDLF